MNDEHLPWLLAGMVGTTVALAAGGVLLAWRALPAEDRSWLDRPPLVFRLLWPLIRLVDAYLSLLPRRRDSSTLPVALRRAGLEFTLTAGQFRAAQTLAMLLSLGVCLLLTSSLAGELRVAAVVLGGLAGVLLPRWWLRERASRRQLSIVRSLPGCLDMIVLSVEAGSHLTGGMLQAHTRLPDSALRDELGRVLRDVRAGRARADALRDFAVRTGSARVRQIVSGIVQAERSGSSIGSLLRAQGEQLRRERFQRAEKQAMEAPVRLLAPLVLFIFPTTFLVLGFLVLSKAIQAGIVTSPGLLWVYHWPATT